MFNDEVHPNGHFRFVNFGHPPPLVFSAADRKSMEIDRTRMVQFLPLVPIPEDHPERSRYLSLQFRHWTNSSDVAELALISPGDILFLYTDGVYDGTDRQERRQIEGRSCRSYAYSSVSASSVVRMNCYR
jgi:serine phosphatase RsbU (regulator of sigma subunit)